MSPDPVTLTPIAAAKVREAMIADGCEGQGLRVGVYGGGCAGLQYLLDFADQPAVDDFVFEQHGITIFVDPFSAAHLRGTVIDHLDEPTRTGFELQNPNVMRGCGCGLAV